MNTTASTVTITKKRARVTFSSKDVPTYTHTFGKRAQPCFIVSDRQKHKQGPDYVLVQDQTSTQTVVRKENTRKVVYTATMISNR